MAAPELTTRVTQLPDSRVSVDVEVPAEEVERRIERAARELGRSMRIPGFRRGKVPAPIVIRRVGREAVLDEAVRDSLSSWYVTAIGTAGIASVGDPELALSELPAPGEALRFSIEIGVLPTAKLGDIERLDVARREPSADEEELARQLEQARERLGRLEPVQRPAGEHDFVVIDYEGASDGEPIEGAAARDQLVELGTGRLIPGFEEGLLGAAAGDERTLELRFPDDYGSEELAGRQASFRVEVKEVREKRLPELDDDFAAEAAGFDSLEELREDIRKRLIELDEQRVEREFRDGVVDAVAERAQIDVPKALIEARAREAWERSLRSLGQQGISKDVYLKLAGKSEEEVLAEAQPDAERSLRREAVIAAVVEAEQIEPSDEELRATVAELSAPDEGGRVPDPADVLEGLRRSGRLAELRADVAARMAVERLVERAQPIAPERAAAREKLWTPGSR